MYNPKPNTVTDRIYCMKVKNLPLRTTGNCSFWGQMLVNGWCENIHVLEDKMSVFLFFLSYIFFTHTNLKPWNFNFNHQHFWHTVTGLSAQKHKHPAKCCRWTCISTACCHAYLWGSEQRVSFTPTWLLLSEPTVQTEPTFTATLMYYRRWWNDEGVTWDFPHM